MSTVLDIEQIIKSARSLCMKENVSSLVRGIYHEKDLHQFRISVEVSKDGRTDLDYYYVTVEQESLAVAYAKAQAVYNFYDMPLPTKEVNNEPLEVSHGEDKSTIESKTSSSDKSSEDEEPAKSSKGSKKPATSKSKEQVVKKPKYVTYDRETQGHKTLLAAFLIKSYGPEWQKTPGVGDFTKSLIGKPFLGEDGNLLPEFIEELNAFFKKGNNVPS